MKNLFHVLPTDFFKPLTNKYKNERIVAYFDDRDDSFKFASV